MTTATAPKAKGLDAAYYFVKDLERATKFYTDLLGTGPTGGHPGYYAEWTFPGGETFGLYQPHEEGTFRTGGGIMFAFDDLKSTVEYHKARGLKFEDEGHVEETPICFMAFASDTEGNGFILHQRK